MQVQKQKGQKKNKLQLWHPFTIFFFFLSLPAIYTSGRVLHVQPTCFHANTELPVTYAWALVASCSLKEFLSSFACQYLPKTWSEWWSRTNAGGDVKAGELLPESGEEDGQLSRSWQWIWFYFVGEGRWRREADRSTVQDGGGGGNTVQLLLDFRSERRWEWNTGRLTKSCPALICSW